MGLTERDAVLVSTAFVLVLAVFGLVVALRDVNSPAAARAKRVWLSTSPAKRWAELFFLRYSAVWIAWFGFVVLSEVWRGFGPWHYMAVGFAMAVPCFVAPFFLEPPSLAAATPFTERYWVKANAWIAIISYVGNYFWTHYFYALLGARYTFSAHRINDVPLAMFLCTHAYFCTYHTATTAVLRRWWTSRTYASLPRAPAVLGTSALVFVLAYLTAFTEAFTIQAFPYYAIDDREFMYTVGSMVYGLYFIVSFPMFARVDEVDCGEVVAPKKTPGRRRGSVAAGAAATDAKAAVAASWSLGATCLDSLAACMLVTILLDLWRLGYGAIVKGVDVPGMLPWVPAP
jgi:cycloeucalenol cycloisomerase